MKYKAEEILNRVVFACSRGSYLISERPALEGVHAALCAKEITELLEAKALVLEFTKRKRINNHQQGKQYVVAWAKSQGLDYETETDISIGVADVLVYANVVVCKILTFG